MCEALGIFEEEGIVVIVAEGALGAFEEEGIGANGLRIGLIRAAENSAAVVFKLAIGTLASIRTS